MSVRRLAEDQFQPAAFAFSEDNSAWAQKTIQKYPEGRQRSAVIPLLMRAQEQDGWVLPTLAPAGSWSDGNDLGIGAVARSGMDAVHWVRLDSRFGTDRSHRAGIPPISLPRLR